MAQAIRGLQSFASAFKVKVGEVELSVADSGVADSGNLETDLPELLLLSGEAARAADTPVAILIDEVQYLNPEDLSALIVSVHKTGQRQLPLILFGAGLPQLAALAGEAKSYAVGPLRSGLIGKGMIYSPQHGDTAFTVPMFDAFMKRSIPDWKPGARRRSKS